jgi:hypothetical protein
VLMQRASEATGSTGESNTKNLRKSGQSA